MQSACVNIRVNVIIQIPISINTRGKDDEKWEKEGEGGGVNAPEDNEE